MKTYNIQELESFGTSELIDLIIKLQANIRLEEIRKSIENENISYGETVELQALSDHIAEDDILLRECAGIPESEEMVCDECENIFNYKQGAYKPDSNDGVWLCDDCLQRIK